MKDYVVEDKYKNISLGKMLEEFDRFKFKRIHNGTNMKWYHVFGVKNNKKYFIGNVTKFDKQCIVDFKSRGIKL